MDFTIIGIDPAFRNTGIAIADYNTDDKTATIHDIDLIQTKSKRTKGMKKNADDLRAAHEIYGFLLKTIEFTGAKVAMVEVPQGTQSARASWTLGIIVGILATLPIEMIQLTARNVKIHAVGSPTADKGEMIRWATGKYPWLPWATKKRHGALVSNDSKNEHMADAVAALECGLQSERWLEIEANLSASI